LQRTVIDLDDRYTFVRFDYGVICRGTGFGLTEDNTFDRMIPGVRIDVVVLRNVQNVPSSNDAPWVIDTLDPALT
jgi:hypothetical protein